MTTFPSDPRVKGSPHRSELEPLGGLIQQLPQLPFQCRQVQAQVWPGAGIDLLQEPEAISGELLKQEAVGGLGRRITGLARGGT